MLGLRSPRRDGTDGGLLVLAPPADDAPTELVWEGPVSRAGRPGGGLLVIAPPALMPRQNQSGRGLVRGAGRPSDSQDWLDGGSGVRLDESDGSHLPTGPRTRLDEIGL